MWENINKCDLKGLNKCFKGLILDTEYENKVKEIKESRRYIKSNWEDIVNYYNQDGAINCSAEGHISHILSDRLSSRPLGWSYNEYTKCLVLEPIRLTEEPFMSYLKRTFLCF